MHRTEDEWVRFFEGMGAFWKYPGNEEDDRNDGTQKSYHAQLTGGCHTNEVFNADIVLQHPLVADEIAYDLVECVQKKRNIIRPVRRVVSPGMGAITFGNDLARHFSLSQGKNEPCLFSFAVNHEAGGIKKMIFPRMLPERHESVLIAEDVVTTGATTDRIAEAALQEGASVWGFVLCILNRSGSDSTKDKEKDPPTKTGRSIISLIDRPMKLWEPGECKMCKQGSKPIRPKGAERWRLLNAIP